MTNSPSSPTTDPRLLQLAPEDNVLSAKETIPAGESLAIHGVRITVDREIPTGHKLALTAILAGEKVIKYAAVIGSATEDIGVGDYVHVHNVKSDYLPSHTLDDSGQRFL